jgi:hypothetical protein
MIDDKPTMVEHVLDKPTEIVRNHTLVVMIAVAVLIAICSVVVAMYLYNSGGTAQIDLSRPDYQSVRNQVTKDTSEINFSSSGALTAQDYNDYRKLYNDQMQQAVKNNGFAGDALGDDAIGLSGLHDAQSQ